MASWLKAAEDKLKEFDEFYAEYSQLKDRSLSTMHILNTKLLHILRSVKKLKDEGNSASDLIGALFSRLAREKPKQFTRENLNSFTSDFTTKIHPDGNVYRGQLPNGVQIVVKNLTEADAVEPIFMAEMNTMFRISHMNLVPFYGFCFERNLKALVFEYMPNGSLDGILFDRHHEDTEWGKLYNIATETAKGLSYLHDGCVDQLLHRGLKTSSVLLDSNMCPKVTNFGVSKIMNRDLTHVTMSQVMGESIYVASEMMLESSHITHKCDVYSFGMILFEILGRRRNINNIERVHFPSIIWDKFARGEVEEIINECRITERNKEKAMILCMVAFWCIQHTPENKPSMNTVVKMLEKEIKVGKPSIPYSPSRPYSVKPFADVVYSPRDFEHQSGD